MLSHLPLAVKRVLARNCACAWAPCTSQRYRCFPRRSHADSAIGRIILVIQWIRRDFAKTLRVDALAQKAALSPVQYPKRSRRLQACTLLVARA